MQVGNRIEVIGGPETSSGGLRLLQKSVHRLEVDVAAAVEHAAYEAIEVFLQRGRRPVAVGPKRRRTVYSRTTRYTRPVLLFSRLKVY